MFDPASGFVDLSPMALCRSTPRCRKPTWTALGRSPEECGQGVGGHIGLVVSLVARSICTSAGYDKVGSKGDSKIRSSIWELGVHITRLNVAAVRVGLA